MKVGIVGFILILISLVGCATPVTVSGRFLDAEGKPVAGVRLAARYLPGAPSAVSGSDGRLTLDLPWPLPRAEPPRSLTRHPPLENQLVLRAASVDRAAWFAWKRVDRPGKVDLGDIHLTAGGTIDGRVVDSDGKPVEGAWVDARAPIEDVPEARVFDWITVGSDVVHPLVMPVFTNADGRYHLDGVPDTYVSVVAKSAASFYSFTKPVAVEHGRVVAAPDIVLRRVPDDHLISGVVLGPDGKPRADIPLRAGDDRDRTSFTTAVTWTRADGRFDLLILPGQNCRISVGSTTTYVVAKGGDRDVVVKIDAQTLALIEKQMAQYDPDAVDPDEETENRAVAKPPSGCVVRGRLLLGGSPPKGWTCRVFNNEHPDLDWSPISADGRFEIRMPGAGSYRLAILLRKPMSGSYQGFDIPIDVKAGVNEWSRDIPVGTLVLEDLEPLPTVQELAEQEGAAEKGYSLYWKGEGFEWTAEKLAGRATTWKLLGAPAGAIQFTRLTEENQGELPGDRPAHMQIQLEPGETKRVKVE
jgi:hypothetical protein